MSRVKNGADTKAGAPAATGAAVRLGGESLTLEDIRSIAAGGTATLADGVAARVRPSRELIERAARGDAPVYGVNTGFGALKSVRISAEDVDKLQVNLVRSHAAGAGPELEPGAVRLMLALRAHSLAQGASGVREELLRHLVAMLERDLLPVIPSKGSLGASGDLIPLAHLALAVIGEGEIRRAGRAAPAAEHYRGAGLPPFRLTTKEGLALINGTQAATAVGLLAILESLEVLRAAHAACALSVEAIRGSARPFDARVQAVRPHEGQIESAAAIRALLEGSGILASHEGCGKVQDPYSFRCAPQVLGASIEAVRYARRALLTEVNSVTDNPLCFADSGEVVSAGNFHGQPVAMALDFLAIGMAEVGSIAERRTFLLLDSEKSGLPPFLCKGAGLGSGLMMVQYLQAALVSENRMLAHPACTDTVPTSAGQEDHVSMAMHAAVKALALVRNVRRIVAAELLCAAQGLEFLRPLRSSERLEALHRGVRERVPELTEDRRQDVDLAALDQWIETGGAAGAARATEF
ncbi:MAG TPA: histidine ammonia-lyase [Candidatus Eisenbacteria bacterium]|nr:histidine ammonia-lyase [Candidatus Eisenbacteria bacterium]